MVQNLESPGLNERVDNIEKRTDEAALSSLDFFKKLLYKQLEFIKIKSNYWSLIFLYIQADNNLNKINGKKTENK